MENAGDECWNVQAHLPTVGCCSEVRELKNGEKNAKSINIARKTLVDMPTYSRLNGIVDIFEEELLIRRSFDSIPTQQGPKYEYIESQSSTKHISNTPNERRIRIKRLAAGRAISERVEIDWQTARQVALWGIIRVPIHILALVRHHWGHSRLLLVVRHRRRGRIQR